MSDNTTETTYPFQNLFDKNIFNYLKNSKKASNSGQVQNGVVMFCDIRHFTHFCDHSTLQALADFINNYYDIIIYHTHRNNGVVDKLMGDGAMCLFGIPDNTLSYLEDSLRAAQGILHDFRSMILEAQQPNLGIGIGLAAGPVIYGTFGNGELLTFTALGETVNLASRIEPLCTGRDILISESIYDQLPNPNLAKLKGRYDFKGISKPHKVYFYNQS